MGRHHMTAEGPVPFTPEEEAEWDAQEAAWADEALMRKATEVRTDRNQRLKDSDWTQVLDAPVDKAAWADYRQALRNISSQPGFPWEVTWPKLPA